MILSRKLVFVWFVSLVLGADASAQVDARPPLEIAGGKVEIGRHLPGSNSLTQIKVRNTSDSPVTITRAAGNCSCMTLIVRDREIKPGRSGTIILSVDAPKKMGRLSRGMYVFAEGYAKPYAVPVFGDLEYAIKVETGEEQPELGSESGTIRLTSYDRRAFRVLRVGDTVMTTEPSEAHTVSYDFSGLTEDSLPRFLSIETDHPGARIIPVRVSLPGVWEAWRAKRRVRIVEDQHVFESIRPGSSQTILVEFAGIAPGPPESLTVDSSNPKIRADVLAVRKPPQGGGGAACDIRVTVDPSLDGPFEALLSFTHANGQAGLDVFGVAEEGRRGGRGGTRPGLSGRE